MGREVWRRLRKYNFRGYLPAYLHTSLLPKRVIWLKHLSFKGYADSQICGACSAASWHIKVKLDQAMVGISIPPFRGSHIFFQAIIIIWILPVYKSSFALLSLHILLCPNHTRSVKNMQEAAINAAGCGGV